MRSLPQGFSIIADSRRLQGRRHRLPVVPGIAAGAILCGMRGYKAISDWADALGQKARMRFGCRHENGHYVVPSEFVIRDCLVEQQAHYCFTVKGRQPALERDIALLLDRREAAD